MANKSYTDPVDGKKRYVDSNGTQWVYDAARDSWSPEANRKPYQDSEGRWHYFDNDSGEWKTEMNEGDVDLVKEYNKRSLDDQVEYAKNNIVGSIVDKTANGMSNGYRSFTDSDFGKAYQAAAYGMTAIPHPAVKLVGGAMQIPLIIGASADIYTNGLDINNGLDILGGLAGMGAAAKTQAKIAGSMMTGASTGSGVMLPVKDRSYLSNLANMNFFKYNGTPGLNMLMQANPAYKPFVMQNMAARGVDFGLGGMQQVQNLTGYQTKGEVDDYYNSSTVVTGRSNINTANIIGGANPESSVEHSDIYNVYRPNYNDSSYTESYNKQDGNNDYSLTRGAFDNSVHPDGPFYNEFNGDDVVTVYKNNDPQAYDIYHNYLEDQYNSRVLGKEQQLPTLLPTATVTPKFQTKGETSQYDIPFPKIDLSLLNGNNIDYDDQDSSIIDNMTEEEMFELHQAEIKKAIKKDPAKAKEYVTDPNGNLWHTSEIMTPFGDELQNHQAVVRGYPNGTGNTWKDKMKRSAEVIMRQNANAGRDWLELPGYLWKYRQYINTGKGLVPDGYHPMEEYDGSEEGNDLIDLQLYGKINPSWGLVEDDDVSYYKPYLDEVFKGRDVRSYTYKPGKKQNNTEGIVGKVTSDGRYLNEFSIPGIDTAHDWIEYGKDEDGNVVIRGTDVIDYYPGDYVQKWGDLGLGKLKAWMQSSMLDKVQQTIPVIKGKWHRPTEEEGFKINDKYKWYYMPEFEIPDEKIRNEKYQTKGEKYKISDDAYVAKDGSVIDPNMDEAGWETIMSENQYPLDKVVVSTKSKDQREREYNNRVAQASAQRDANRERQAQQAALNSSIRNTTNEVAGEIAEKAGTAAGIGMLGAGLVAAPIVTGASLAGAVVGQNLGDKAINYMSDGEYQNWRDYVTDNGKNYYPELFTDVTHPGGLIGGIAGGVVGNVAGNFGRNVVFNNMLKNAEYAPELSADEAVANIYKSAVKNRGKNTTNTSVPEESVITDAPNVEETLGFINDYNRPAVLTPEERAAVYAERQGIELDEYLDILANNHITDRDEAIKLGVGILKKNNPDLDWSDIRVIESAKNFIENFYESNAAYEIGGKIVTNKDRLVYEDLWNNLYDVLGHEYRHKKMYDDNNINFDYGWGALKDSDVMFSDVFKLDNETNIHNDIYQYLTDPDKGYTELIARIGQFKDYLGIKDPNQDVTKGMFQKIKDNYIKDTKMDNNVKELFEIIKDEDAFLKFINSPNIKKYTYENNMKNNNDPYNIDGDKEYYV